MAPGSKSDSRSQTKQQRLQTHAMGLLKQSLSTTHSRIVTCGVLVGLCYLPGWLTLQWRAVVQGSSIPFLCLAFVYLGLEMIWRQRSNLATMAADEAEQMVGHLLIIGGAIAFPFCFFSLSLQALICIIVLAGIVYSTWGFLWIQQCWLAGLILAGCIYPDWSFLSNLIWRIITPHNFLENFMAWISSLALQLAGQSATANGAYLALPKGAVEVASGCSGFDMAFTIAGFTVVLGLFLKQSWHKITLVAAIGVGMALIFNIPRIMVLAMASVYWGKESFEFWHGPIGGQIFSGVLLTIYYYIAMGFFNQKSAKKSLTNI